MAIAEHEVIIAGGGPTGMMLAGELAAWVGEGSGDGLDEALGHWFGRVGARPGPAQLRA